MQQSYLYVPGITLSLAAEECGKEIAKPTSYKVDGYPYIKDLPEYKYNIPFIFIKYLFARDAIITMTNDENLEIWCKLWNEFVENKNKSHYINNGDQKENGELVYGRLTEQVNKS